MKIDFAARVDIGPKETNDDRVLISGQVLDMQSFSGTTHTPALAVVCDGCGGYAGGGIAAQTVLETLASEIPEMLADPGYLSQALENCRQIIMHKKEEMPHFSAMCTTIAGCLFSEDSTVIFHSGDSRVYRHDRWGIARMTRDHSVVQDMIDMGEITPEEALEHPKRNVIMRCIGADCLPPEIYLSHSPINPGEKYMFCSDGLWEILPESEIKEILDSEMTLQEMADELIDRAIRQGAYDNISVCICAVQGTEKAEENKPFILD